MKKIIILLIACIGFSAVTAEGQTKTKKKARTVKVVKTTPKKPAPSTSTNTAVSKSVSDGATGVMGQDTIKNNKKGLNRNMNTNTGTELPPSDGGR